MMQCLYMIQYLVPSVEYAARCYFCGYERTDEKTKEIVAKMWERRLNDETD